MSKPLTVLGDKTDHGGTVMSATSFSMTGGKPIARIGDKVPCPKCNAPNAVIVGPGDPTTIVDGAPVSLHGDKTSCGATLIASQRPTTAGGPGGASQSASATNASAQASQLAPADMALQSDAQSFDELPDEAKPYVFDQANKAGVFAGDDLLATSGLEQVDHETHDDGMDHFSTDDPNLAARTARAQMGLGPYETLPPDQIMDTDPNAPEARAGGSSVHYKHLSQIDTTGGSWASRFADSRPVEGVAKPSFAPGALPQASPSGSGIATAGTVTRSSFGIAEHGMKASEQGLKQRINIYEGPDGKKMAQVSKWSPSQLTGELESTPLTKTQASAVLNDSAAQGLDERTQQIEKEKLNDFYRSHFGG